MEKIEVTWSNSIKVWWSFFWRITLFRVIAGAVAGGIAGGVLGAIGKVEYAGTAGSIMGYIVTIPVSMWCIKKTLNKNYKGFSTCLVSKDEENT